MSGSVVNLETFSDADFARAFKWKIGTGEDDYFDFTNHALAMMVRRNADDAEVFVSLESDSGGLNGILFHEPEPGDTKITTFTIIIPRDHFQKMSPGEYVHSLILIRPDGLRDDIWRGTLTHAIGPTR